MRTFRLEVVTRDAGYPPRNVTSLNVPAEKGRLTVLARHQPLVCMLHAGQVVILDAEGAREDWRIGEGTMTVTPKIVTLLVHDAERVAGGGSGVAASANERM